MLVPAIDADGGEPEPVERRQDKIKSFAWLGKNRISARHTRDPAIADRSGKRRHEEVRARLGVPAVCRVRHPGAYGPSGSSGSSPRGIRSVANSQGSNDGEGFGGQGGKVLAPIAGIEADAYARSRADARKALLDLLQSGARQTSDTRAARGKRTRRGKRAPRDSVRPFVERALGERPGATAREILGHAASDAERSIKLSSVRVELRNGYLQGRVRIRRRALSAFRSVFRGAGGSSIVRIAPGSAPVAGGARSDAPPAAGDAAYPEDGEGESGKTLDLNF